MSVRSLHSQPLLSVRNITVRFDGIVALDRVSFDVPRGSVTGLIGPNGAGKTTLFNCFSRLYDYCEGSICFNGHRLEELPSHRIASLGIGRTFQHPALFHTMSVFDNIMVGRHARTSKGFLSHALRLPGVAREEAECAVHAKKLINLLDLKSVAAARVSDLPIAIQKRVELARALASNPKLLLLDEPAAGLNHEEVKIFEELIRSVHNEQELTVLLVEHHMNLVMNISNQIVVLNFGKKIADGTPEQVRRHPEVIRAYLGSEDV